MNADFTDACIKAIKTTVKETKARAKQDIKDEKKHTYRHHNKDMRTK